MKLRDLYLLLALSEQDRHGAQLCREVLRLSEGQLHLWPARLYGALEALGKKGWIEDLTALNQHPSGKSERRRYYRISLHGLQVLEAETDRLAGLVDLSRLRTARISGRTQ